MLPIVDIFSKRQKRLQGKVPEVYVYDNLPEPLRSAINSPTGRLSASTLSSLMMKLLSLRSSCSINSSMLEHNRSS